jgi:L-amino acid N-acyltransferase YncA
MSDVIIRAAALMDSAAIAAIYNHYVANTVITFEEEPVPEQSMAARITEILSQDLPWLVAERDGQVIGYCYASRWKVRSAYRHTVETTIYLKQGHEGRGLGRQLYGALLDILKTRDIHAAIGGAALPNAASVALHEKLGFEHVGTFREVGFKLGRRVDVAYWQLLLS